MNYISTLCTSTQHAVRREGVSKEPTYLCLDDHCTFPELEENEREQMRNNVGKATTTATCTYDGRRLSNTVSNWNMKHECNLHLLTRVIESLSSGNQETEMCSVLGMRSAFCYTDTVRLLLEKQVGLDLKNKEIERRM